MKAAILRSADSVPVYEDFEEPPAAEGYETVSLVAAGIAHNTRGVATGRHYSRRPVFPVIPGQNAVARTASGELVFTGAGQPPFGSFAERFPSPDAMRIPLPACASPEAVAAGVNPGMASWLPLMSHQNDGEKLGPVMILGVTGISGYLAAQNAKLLGATQVIGVGRDPAGLERAAATGARTVQLTGDQDADADALARVLDGDPPGLVLDFVWGPVAEIAFAALTSLGFSESGGASTSYVQIGALAGTSAAVPAALLRSRKVTISGSGIGSVPASEIQARIPGYIKLIADGSVQVPFRIFKLSDVSTAWPASAETGPRVVLIPG